MRNYRDLIAWQRAHELTLAIYRSTSRFPPEERFALVSQMRRAASSIGMNIAEGAGRSSPADFKRFLSIAAGSASEVQYQLELARDLGFITDDFADSFRLAHEVKKILRGLMNSIG